MQNFAKKQNELFELSCEICEIMSTLSFDKESNYNFGKVFDSYISVMWKTMDKLTVQQIYFNVIHMWIFVKRGINVIKALL